MKLIPNETNNEEAVVNSKTTLLFWCVTFGVIASAIVLSNGLTVAGFVHMRRTAHRRRNSHLFLLNLAISDLLVGCAAIPVYIYMLGEGIWASAIPVRTVFRFFDIFLGLASVFSITTVSLERFFAAQWPMRFRMLKPRHYLIAIGLLWISAGTAAIMNVLSVFGPVTRMLFISFALTAPLVITTASYIGLWLVKSGSRPLSQRRTTYDGDQDFNRTLLIVTTVFFLTWSPFLILNVVIVYCKSSPCRVLVFPFKLLHYGNSCANPVIYVFRIPVLRRATKDVFLAVIPCFMKVKCLTNQNRDIEISRTTSCFSERKM